MQPAGPGLKDDVAAGGVVFEGGGAVPDTVSAAGFVTQPYVAEIVRVDVAPRVRVVAIVNLD